MSTSSTAITPSGSSSSTLIPFNGTSTYSSSFQTVLNKAVQEASLPMEAIQTDVTTLQSQQSALATLESTFAELQSAVSAVSTAVSGAPSATTSSSAVSATADSTALPGTYSIQVDSLGSETTTMSENGLTTVADPTSANISSSSQYTLTVNGTNYTITPSGDTLDDLVTAINNAGDGVQATTVNIGSNTSPDYRLAVTSNNLAPDTIQLNDGTQDLLNTLSTGANATYSVNGQSTTLSSNSNEVTLSQGLTVQLNQVTSSPVTVTVSQSYAGLQTALSNLATTYDSAVNALAQDRGSTGGALTGDQIVYQLTDMLQSISTYTSGSGSVNSLADLGLSIDQTGQMSFDASSFNTADSSAVQQFLGSTTTGGFLQTANNSLESFIDPTNGLLVKETSNLQTQITSDNSQIAQQQTQISSLQTNLEQQLSQADAAIATLQAQTSYFQQLFTAEYGNGTSTTSGG
jgi:flagellar hook-associated protein 2